MPLLSYVIPAYNESRTLEQLVQKVLDCPLPEGFEKQLILVNDCSTDNTLQIAEQLSHKDVRIQVINNSDNLGKSQSVRKGILQSTGDYVVVQDADLEYDPMDITHMLTALLRENCHVAYGNRFGKDNGMIYAQNFFGNIFLSLTSSIFTSYRLRVVIPDMEVCYKLIRGDIARDLAPKITARSNFGFEPEITARLSKYTLDGKHLKFIIMPVSYYPRTIQEGKKMKAFKDGFKALWEIIYYNVLV